MDPANPCYAGAVSRGARVLLILNGSRERYAGGADEARYRVWSRYCAPGTTLEIGYLPSESESGGVSRTYRFGSGEAFAMSVLYPDRCAQAEADGYDAAIIHCCADPGLAAARARARRMPIVGPGEASLLAARTLGRPFGMTVPSGESAGTHREQIAAAGAAELCVGVQPIGRPIAAYGAQDPQAMEDALCEAAQQLVAKGADVICPSGLAYIPVRVSAERVAQRIGVPVLDPAFLAIRSAEMLVEVLSRATVPA